MELDLDDLLAGFGEAEPAGPDLEYDPTFSELTIAATPKAEQQVGDKIIPAEEPDYAEVLRLGRELMERTIDIRVAVYMAEAALNREGFPLFARILRYIEGALERHWEHVHPQLDAEDDDDPTERVNALRGLADPETVLRQLRRAPLSESRMMGRMSLRHLAVARGEMPAPADMENPPDMAAFAAALKDTGEEEMAAIRGGIADALEAVRAIDALLDEKVPGQGPDLSALVAGLRAAQEAIAETLGAELPAEAGEEIESDPAGTAASAATGAGAARGAVGGISNSNDVIRALDLIMEYYARNEPSSPVPLLLRRAKRLVNADFLTIMEDMAHAGLEQVRIVGGLEPQEEEY